MTAFADIGTAIVAALNSGTPVSPNVFRARARTIAAQHGTAVVVKLKNTEPDARTVHNVQQLRATLVDVACYARAVPGSGAATPDLAVDALLAAVQGRVMADTTLGGLVTDINTGPIEWDEDAEAEQLGCVTVTYEVLHNITQATLA